MIKPQIQLSWLFDVNVKEFKTNRNFDYFIFLLEYQGEHSLLGYLWDNDMIPNKQLVETECQIVSDSQVLFSLRMEMHHNDSETYNQIFCAIYLYFNKIRDEGPQFKIIKMLKDIRVMRYQSDIVGTRKISWDLVDVLSGVENNEDIE